MNHEQISVMGEQAFNSIHGTLTKKAIGMLMILAYNLMDDNGFRSVGQYLEGPDKHLKGKFRDFYKFKFPFDEFHPDMDVIMDIKKQFELDSRFRNTLYVILSSGCAEPQGQIIKDFLYEIHLKQPIRRIHQGRYGVSVPALTKDHKGKKINTPYPEEVNTPY
ncbi:ribonuclease H-like domain-containing protein [Tanacetum coccineum]|uniref:Ribonuclease H-like domain-containing protein n=1 Tax=Tanacetum coccineum TaxID=301880 RepID=A0ABQ5CBU4_9ASTR